MTAEVLRAEAPAVEPEPVWKRWGHLLPGTILVFVGSGWRWASGLVGLVAASNVGAWWWRRWRPPAPSGAVEVDGAGITRTGRTAERFAFTDLARVDRQEQWPNLALHPRSGKTVRLFPWNADRDDEAASAVASVVLERAAAAGVDTTQQPLALWKPSMYVVDWDRALAPPSRWSRLRSSSDPDASN